MSARVMCCIALLFLTACTCQPARDKAINHVVLVWFNDDVDESYIETVKQQSEKLRSISQVRSLSMGEAVTSERAIVDDSFDLGLLFIFDNATDMNAYLVDPLHTDYVDRYLKGKVKKLLVYDF